MLECKVLIEKMKSMHQGYDETKHPYQHKDKQKSYRKHEDLHALIEASIDKQVKKTIVNSKKGKNKWLIAKESEEELNAFQTLNISSSSSDSDSE